MEIRVNGKAVANVKGFTRSVSIRSGSGGEITNFSTAPDVPFIDIITEQKLPANAPRLDEIEALEHIAASEAGLYGPQEGVDSEVPLAEQNTSVLSFDETEEDEEDEEDEEETEDE